eukprot:5408581-Karenia_brevis.AAC.1
MLITSAFVQIAVAPLCSKIHYTLLHPSSDPLKLRPCAGLAPNIRHSAKRYGRIWEAFWEA